MEDMQKSKAEMKNKIRKIVGIAIILLIVIAVGISKGREIYDNSHVRFADDNMGKVICGSMRRGNVTPENVTHRDLKEVKRIEMGFIGYYETLKDIKRCTELEFLTINCGIGDDDPAFKINQGKANKGLTKDEIEDKQKEMGKILPRLSNLKELWLADKGEIEWTSLEFLKKCDQIEELHIIRCTVKDYSALQGCTSLTHLSIHDSEISRAEDIIGLENLKFITFYDTPLAENPEEIKKLQEAYPDAEIRWERKE